MEELKAMKMKVRLYLFQDLPELLNGKGPMVFPVEECQRSKNMKEPLLEPLGERSIKTSQSRHLLLKIRQQCS